MNEKHGWIIKNAACEECGGTHDLFFQQEPVLHRDIEFTCPNTDTGTRLRKCETPQPIGEQPPDSVPAFIK